MWRRSMSAKCHKRHRGPLHCVADSCSTRVARLNLARHISGLLVAAEKLFSFLQSGYFSLADVACSSAVVAQK